MDTKDFFEKICNEASISGYETVVGDIIKSEFSKYCDTVTVDKLGNIIGFKKGKGKGKILIAAHMDEIGLMVSGIEKGGFLRFVKIGGYDQRILVGQEVLVHGRKTLFGVIGMKPPHLNKPDELNKTMRIDELSIDTGYSEEKLKELVKIGDVITVNRKLTPLLNDNFSGKALDNRAGVTAMFESMKQLKDYNHDVDVYYVATVQEEVGVRGAIVSGFSIQADVSIALDVGFAKTPELKDYETILLNEGPSIMFGPNGHPRVNEFIISVCKKNNIKHQIDVTEDMAGADVRALQVAGSGSRSALITMPLKYMHTTVETMSMQDITETARLLTCFIIEFNGRDLEECLCY